MQNGNARAADLGLQSRSELDWVLPEARPFKQRGVLFGCDRQGGRETPNPLHELNPAGWMALE